MRYLLFRYIFKKRKIIILLTGYVFNPFSKQREVIIGNEGLTMRFEYDAAGRNKYTYKEMKSGVKVIPRNKYNFCH